MKYTYIRMKRILLVFITITAIVGIGWRVSRQPKKVTLVPAVQKVSKVKDQPKIVTPLPFDKKQYSIDTPGSIWWIVNKKRPLTPSTYVPADLVVPAVRLRLGSGSEEMKLSAKSASEIPNLFNAAKSAGYQLILASGYRSYYTQVQLYNSYVKKDGQAAADRYSARPGNSEHQTGLAFDVCVTNSACDLQQSFGQTPSGKWLAQHAYEYGFIVRYLDGKEAITGYQYEPWHLRYVGKDLALQLHNSGQTMEEFFGL